MYILSFWMENSVVRLEAQAVVPPIEMRLFGAMLPRWLRVTTSGLRAVVGMCGVPYPPLEAAL